MYLCWNAMNRVTIAPKAIIEQRMMRNTMMLSRGGEANSSNNDWEERNRNEHLTGNKNCNILSNMWCVVYKGISQTIIHFKVKNFHFQILFSLFRLPASLFIEYTDKSRFAELELK